MSEEQKSSELSSAARGVWHRRAFETKLLNLLPDLRAFARFLTHDPVEADDLVQDTLVRSLRAYAQFDLDTNMKAWTFTIMRNLRINGLRRRPISAVDPDQATELVQHGSQEDNVALKQVLNALERLSEPHRQVIALVRGSGCSYAEAAEIMKCSIGTIKSRLNRADAALRQVLGPEFHSDRRSTDKVDANSPDRAASPWL